jgi:hypothetical protein
MGTTASLGLNQFKNLSKAKAVVDERKAKKAEVQLREVGIRVVATVWMSDKNKLTQVSLTIKAICLFHNGNLIDWTNSGVRRL